MKKILIISLALFNFNLAYMQTDAKNQQKYWKFRNSFRQDFIRIGLNDGESLPMGRRGFGKCIDNTNPYVKQKYGQLYWGDGVIRHGHYIGFLATEYRLLKNQGKDVTAVLNELYYALQAFNRLDENAEYVISLERNNIQPQNGSLNGFYLRDDIPKDFDDHWQDEPIRARGVHGLYNNNNSAQVDSENDSGGGEYDAEIGHNFGWNEPSLDQMSSMLVGLKVCYKLLDDGLWVQPTPNDPIIGLKQEVIQITHRIVDYANQNNWFLLDMYGFPVENGGGDLALTAYPIGLIGNQITGLDYTNTLTRRTILKYAEIRKYFNIESSTEKQNWYDDSLNFHQRDIVDYLQNNSFNEWQNGGGPNDILLFTILINQNYTFDSDLLNDKWDDGLLLAIELFIDWNANNGDHKFDDTFIWPISKIRFDDMNLRDYNNTILMNLGVASEVFDTANTKIWEDGTKHHQLALIQSLLTDTVPVNNQQFYQDLLNSMPVYGAFKFRVNETNGAWNDPTIMSQTVFPTDWGGEYRWTHYGESTIPDKGNEGQYTGLDYMYLHNLYYLVFPDNLPEYKEDFTCICDVIENSDLQISNIYHATDTATFQWVGPYIVEDYINNIHIIENQISYSGVPGVGEQITYSYISQSDYDAVQNDLAQNGGFLNGMVYELSNLQPCVPKAFSNLGNSLNTQYDLANLHDNYAAMKIYLNKYQTELFTVQNGGQLDIESRMIVCENQILNIESGGTVNLNDGEIRVNTNATVYISGNLFVAENQKLILEDSSKLVILGGGTLHNQGYIEVNPNAVIEYNDGANLIMDNTNAEIHFKGGDLLVKENATFTFTHTNGPSGQLRFSKWGEHIHGEANSKISLSGDGYNDALIVIDDNAHFWNDTPDDLNLMVFQHGKVVLGENSKFVATQRLTTSNFNYISNSVNSEVITFDFTTISSANFQDVRLNAVQIYRPNAKLIVLGSNFDYTSLNTDTYEIVKVEGKSYSIANSTFTTQGRYILKSYNLTQTSFVSNCVFNGVTFAQQNRNAIFDNSNHELIVKNSQFNNLNFCVEKFNGKLKLRCNEFNNFYYSAVVANDNCYLEMSSVNDAGYNKFYEGNFNDPDANISINNAQFVQLSYGRNAFDDHSYRFIDGSVQISYQAKQYINARKNLWGASNNYIPSANKFNVNSSITGFNIAVNRSNPQGGNCGQYDGNVGALPVGANANATAFINTPSLGRIKMGLAIEQTIRKTEILDNLKDDLLALEIFKEILTYDYNQINKHTRWYLYYGLEYMKQTLQHTFESGKICKADNIACFHPGVQNYVDALNYLTQSNVISSNYRKMFNLEMDKAHLFHMLGNNQLALDIMYNMENCGLDFDEQKHLNHWKYQLEKESKKINYGYQAELLDTTWVDTNSYFQPTNQNFGNFGSEITSHSSVSFFDCSKSRSNVSSVENTEVQLTIYPNPSNGQFNVEYYLPEGSTGEIIIYSTDGKQIYRTMCYEGNQFMRIDVSKIERGIYIYSYVIEGAENVRGKIVVE